MLNKWFGNTCIYDVDDMKYYETDKLAIDGVTPIYTLIYAINYDELSPGELEMSVTEYFINKLKSKDICMGFKSGDLYVGCNGKEKPVYEYMKDALENV